ncbi:MAG TPA: drug/metabolite exporter YedA [Kofleriaceae bacterium]
MVAASTSIEQERPALDIRLVLSLAAVYVIWSSTYLAISIALVELPALLTASLRFVAAGLVMLLIAMRRGVAFPSAREWMRVVPVGVLLFAGGNGFVVLAEQSVSSGGAAVVCATMPLWVGVLGTITGVRSTRREWVALGLGFAGVLVLMGGPALSGEPHHIALVIGSPICWALGSVMARRLPGKQDTFMAPAMQMIIGGAALAIGAAMLGERLPAEASATSWLAVGYLWVFGSLIGFTAYNWLLRNARPVVATSYAYVNPPLAVVFGAVISGEAIGMTTILALVLIVGAVMLALRKPRPAR